LFITIIFTLCFCFAQDNQDNEFQIPEGYTSIYTPLDFDSCHILELSNWNEEAPIDYFTLECPAYGGFRVIIAGGDLRSHLELMQHGEDIPQTHTFYQDVWSEVGQFPYVSGSVLEWRYYWSNEGETVLPVPNLVGIIYRVAGSDPEDLSERSKLVAVRLHQDEVPCLVGVVDGNEEARALLDTPTTPCITN